MGMPYHGERQVSEDTYALKRDYNASSRCWLLDVARKLENPYNLHGFDISLDQAPTTTLDPTSFSTIRFHTWDLLTEPPKVFIGAFDIVHIRLITVVFSENEKAIPIIESLRKLLKPGGYLQWEEVDNTTCSVFPSPDGTRALAMEQALAQLASSGKGDWKQDAARLLNNNGFMNAQQFHVEPTEYLARYWTDIYLACWAEFAGKVLDNPGKAKALGEEAMVEARHGAVIRCPLWVWIAQKSFPGSTLINGDANGFHHGVTTSSNGMRGGIPADDPDRASRDAHSVAPLQIRNGAERSDRTGGHDAISNSLMEDDAASCAQIAKKQSFLLRNKMYRSLQRLKSG